MSKDKYKVRNWKAYNQGLINRGRIDIWIDREELKQWHHQGSDGKAGRPRQYSDSAILICLLVRKLYHLSLRGCQGFMISVFGLMKLSLKVPCYTQICRRSATLQVPLGALPGSGKVDIAVDSTGLKVYGEGEWKVRKHGWTKHRRWMKLHLAIDLESEQIVAADLTSNAVDDSKGCEGMIFSDTAKASKISSFRADMAYDTKRLRRLLWERGISPVIPPISRAVKSKGDKPYLLPRDQALETIEKSGKKHWQKTSGYHQRSLTETAVFRFKTIIGPCLSARKPDTQKTEALVGVSILNRMLQLTKPLSYKAA